MLRFGLVLHVLGRGGHSQGVRDGISILENSNIIPALLEGLA